MNITSVILAGFDWFMRIAKLNIIWFISCLAGLFMFSFFPATVAAFSVTQQWAAGNSDVSIWKTFKQTFKVKYWRAQFIGLLLSLSFLALYVDIRLFRTIDSQFFSNILVVFMVLLLFLLVTITLYIFPIVAQSNLQLTDTFKNALFSGLSYIHLTVINLAGVIGILFVSYLFPASLLFLTGGAVILWLTCMAYIVNGKIETKYAQLNSTLECD
ncbi:YesL family protein [Virgibacillus litoralis]|uniref:Membrane protein YesL n=1 Tax=Virgibacillus litoralis TaxID=578221 RepID=A0ABS4HC29_9BACI|nr:DUF624 domain-containing protein [Virgibacillus litoralis]MBP1948413.1 putative membrane protein YesL [Virgibacillus litoralis]